MDSIRKVTQALESSDIMSDNREEEDINDVIFKRSVGSTDVTTDEPVPPVITPTEEKL